MTPLEKRVQALEERVFGMKEAAPDSSPKKSKR